ncbi:hypothetical protein CDAR_589391 [Caerostris darwini]|uniref:Uncharacterized protein n=1 Tax=Caerostris darwini TaxID=1538125 RepID=A0AAV4TBM4_9ARAC|nr:hypothetical protein CDAR_589391 [Caerostris darwini]
MVPLSETHGSWISRKICPGDDFLNPLYFPPGVPLRVVANRKIGLFSPRPRNSPTFLFLLGLHRDTFQKKTTTYPSSPPTHPFSSTNPPRGASESNDSRNRNRTPKNVLLKSPSGNPKRFRLFSGREIGGRE